FASDVARWETNLNQQIPVVMYEGGEGLYTNMNVPWANAYVAAQSDSGMFGVNMLYLNALNNAGVDTLAYFNDVQGVNPFGEWGTMEYIGEPSNLPPKYNALINFDNAPKIELTGVPSTVTAGTQSITVTAYNPNGVGVDTAFTDTIQFSSSDSR